MKEVFKYLVSKFCGLLNSLVSIYFNKKWTPNKWRLLNNSKYDMFKKNGEGIYTVNFKKTSGDNAFYTKLIAKECDNWTHSVIALYSENIKKWFTNKEWDRLKKKWKIYYGEEKSLNSKVKVLVLASSDSIGQNYFDYSKYHSRRQEIDKWDLSEAQIKKLLKWLMNPKVMDSNYDYVGLAFFPLRKILHAEEDYFCSELCFQAFKQALKIKIANVEYRPSPLDMVEFQSKQMKTVYSDIQKIY